MSCAQVLTTVFLDYISSEEGIKSWIKNIIYSVFIMIVVTLVGYSRMFNGVHTLDQVLTGLIIGLWIAIFGHYLFR
jgi:membrane-associated phospholipid phosphatase